MECKPLMEANDAVDFIIRTRVGDAPEMPSATDIFNERVRRFDPYRGDFNPVLDRLASFKRDDRIVQADPEPELDAWVDTINWRSPVESDTLSSAITQLQDRVTQGSDYSAGTVPGQVNDAFIDVLSNAFAKSKKSQKI